MIQTIEVVVVFTVGSVWLVEKMEEYKYAQLEVDSKVSL